MHKKRSVKKVVKGFRYVFVIALLIATITSRSNFASASTVINVPVTNPHYISTSDYWENYFMYFGQFVDYTADAGMLITNVASMKGYVVIAGYNPSVSGTIEAKFTDETGRVLYDGNVSLNYWKNLYDSTNRNFGSQVTLYTFTLPAVQSPGSKKITLTLYNYVTTSGSNIAMVVNCKPSSINVNITDSFTTTLTEVDEISQNTLTAATNAQNAAQQARDAANNTVQYAQQARDAANAVKNNTWDSAEGKSSATLAKEARDRANDALNAVNDVKNVLNNVQSSITNIQNSFPPILNKISGLNGATATSSGSLRVVLDYSNATQYSYKIDNGGWSPWMPISDTVSIPVPKGVHTLTIQVANGPVGQPGPTAKSSMQVISL